MIAGDVYISPPEENAFAAEPKPHHSDLISEKRMRLPIQGWKKSSSVDLYHAELIYKDGFPRGYVESDSG